MTFSPLEVLTGPIENGFLVGSFTWGDATGYSFFGTFYNSQLRKLYLMVFFKTVIFKFGDN